MAGAKILQFAPESLFLGFPGAILCLFAPGSVEFWDSFPKFVTISHIIIMKQTYLEPDVQVLQLSAENSVLTASNEGFPVNPVDPGLSSVPFDYPIF